MDQTVELLRQPSPSPRVAMTVNVAIMWMADRDPRLADIVERASIRVADGMGLVWAWRLLGRTLPERVAGVDLMEQLVAAAGEDGRSVYLLGAKQEVLDRLVEVFAERYPATSIAGTRNGYFGVDDHRSIVADIAASNADILFIGMPSPAKEYFADDHLEAFGCDLVIGVGGSFDVLSGLVPRAPKVMQRLGLEWFWRLICEPRRMWRRYAVTNSWLVAKIATTLARRRFRR